MIKQDYKNKKASLGIEIQEAEQSHEREMSCRGRTRTSTGQLAETQSLVVNPGRPYQW
jgi:hypothetical protein